MTNTKFRKRALLSSVAMLLVALVALGSATFAWFTEDPTADATGIPAYAQTSKGLLISTDTDTEFSHHAKLSKNIGGNIYLAPATTNNGTAYKTIEAKAADSYQLDTEKTWADAAVVQHTAGTGVYHEKMYLKMTTAPATDTDVNLVGLDIQLENASHTMYDALVVTLVYGSTVKHYSVNGGTINTWSNFDTATTTTSATLTAVRAPGKTGLTEKVGTFSAGSSAQIEVEVYVWLNGEHNAVFTDNSDARQLIKEIGAYFALAQ